MPTPEPAAACRLVVKEYVTAGERVTAISDVTVSFERGQITALAGPSGSGKSTLLRLLSCVDRPTRGSVSVDGMEVSLVSARKRRRLRRRRLGYLFQSPSDNLLPYLSASAHVRFAAAARGVTLPGGAIDLLDQLGLSGRDHHLPSQLSGGEQQRLALAAAVVGAPVMVVADEPTAQLDLASARLLLSALSALRDQGMTFVVSSHDPLVTDIADRVVHLSHGELIA